MQHLNNAESEIVKILKMCKHTPMNNMSCEVNLSARKTEWYGLVNMTQTISGRLPQINKSFLVSFMY